MHQPPKDLCGLILVGKKTNNNYTFIIKKSFLPITSFTVWTSYELDSANIIYRESVSRLVDKVNNRNCVSTTWRENWQTPRRNYLYGRVSSHRTGAAIDIKLMKYIQRITRSWRNVASAHWPNSQPDLMDWHLGPVPGKHLKETDPSADDAERRLDSGLGCGCEAAIRCHKPNEVSTCRNLFVADSCHCWRHRKQKRCCYSLRW